jgi:hypothetical protein
MNMETNVNRSGLRLSKKIKSLETQIPATFPLPDVLSRTIPDLRVYTPNRVNAPRAYSSAELQCVVDNIVKTQQKMDSSLSCMTNPLLATIQKIGQKIGLARDVYTSYATLLDAQEHFLTEYVHILETFGTGLENQTNKVQGYVDHLLKLNEFAHVSDTPHSQKISQTLKNQIDISRTRFEEKHDYQTRRDYLDNLYAKDSKEHRSALLSLYLGQFGDLELNLRDASHSVRKLQDSAILHRDYISHVKIPLLSMGFTQQVLSSLELTSTRMRDFTKNLYAQTTQATGLLAESSTLLPFEPVHSEAIIARRFRT